MSWGSWIAASAMALCGGCLVTEPIEFPTPIDYPPEILAAPNGPALGDNINLSKAVYPISYPFEVRVRDLNVDQDLQAHVRLVKEPGDRPMNFERPLVPRGDRAERTVTIQVPTNSLTPFRCARLDLVVSGSFNRFQDGGFETIPTGSNDIARAMWWIYEGDLDAPEAAFIAASCPNEYKVGVTATGGRGATP
jgi:hypothetical protein